MKGCAAQRRLGFLLSHGPFDFVFEGEGLCLVVWNNISSYSLLSSVEGSGEESSLMTGHRSTSATLPALVFVLAKCDRPARRYW